MAVGAEPPHERGLAGAGLARHEDEATRAAGDRAVEAVVELAQEDRPLEKLGLGAAADLCMSGHVSTQC